MVSENTLGSEHLKVSWSNLICYLLDQSSLSFLLFAVFVLLYDRHLIRKRLKFKHVTRQKLILLGKSKITENLGTDYLHE